MAYLQPYIGCVCLQGSAAPPGECPGIEGGEVEREEGGQRRKQKEWEKENDFFLKKRTNDFLPLCFVPPLQTNLISPFHVSFTC